MRLIAPPSDRFVSVLDELCGELPLLREPVVLPVPSHRAEAIARRMFRCGASLRGRMFSLRLWQQSPERWRKKFLHSMNVAAPRIVDALM